MTDSDADRLRAILAEESTRAEYAARRAGSYQRQADVYWTLSGQAAERADDARTELGELLADLRSECSHQPAEEVERLAAAVRRTAEDRGQP